MRGYSGDIIDIQQWSDTILQSVVAAAVGQAFDWPTNAKIVRFSGATTLGGIMSFAINLRTTAAFISSSAAAGFTTGSSASALVRVAESKTFRIPADSTGFSFIAGSAGVVGVEVWAYAVGST